MEEEEAIKRKDLFATVVWHQAQVYYLALWGAGGFGALLTDDLDGDGVADHMAPAASELEVDADTGDVKQVEYEYVSECSNRGTCDTDEGLCMCFTGFAGDDCSVISALAI